MKRRPILFWALVVAWASPAVGYQSPRGFTGPTTSRVPEGEPLLLQVPDTAEGIRERIDLAERQMEELRPTTQPESQPTEQAKVAVLDERRALLDAWQNYLGQLKRIESLHQTLERLSSQRHLENLAETNAELQAKTATLRNDPIPPNASQQYVEDLNTRLKEREAERTARSKQQSQRSAQLSAGFNQQRTELQAGLERLTTDRRQTTDALAAATTTAPAAQDALRIKLRRLEVQKAGTELALHALGLEREQTELLQQQDSRYLEVLSQHVAALRDRVAELTQARRRDALQVIQSELEQATEPHLKAFYRLKYFAEYVLTSYFAKPELVGELQSRFSEGELDRLEERLEAETAEWAQIQESLDYRSGEDVVKLHRAAVRSARQLPQELSDLQAQLTVSLGQLHDLQTLRDQTQEQFTVRAQRVSDQAEGAGEAAATKLRTEITTLRSRLEQSMQQTIALAEELVERLRTAVEMLKKHIESVKVVREELRWEALTRRESGLAGIDWRRAGLELGQLIGVRTEQPEDSAADEGLPDFADVLASKPHVRSRLSRRWKVTRDDLHVAFGRSWLASVVLLAIAGVVGGVGTHYARRAAVRSERRIEAHHSAHSEESAPPPFHTRATLIFWRFCADLLLPAVTLLALWIAASVGELRPRTLGYVGGLLAWLLAAFGFWRLSHRAFTRAGAGQRILPCQDAVASYWRYWLDAVLLLTLILLLPLYVLRAADAASAAQDLLWELFKALLLALLLVFGARKKRVIHVSGPVRRNWVMSLVSAVYPFLYLVALALLVMQAVGYGVLVEYVGAGLIKTALALLLIAAVVEYLGGLFDSLAETADEEREGVASAQDPSKPVDQQPEEKQPRLVHALLRLGGAAGAVVLAIDAWGANEVWDRVNWKTAALIAVVVAAAFAVDRILATALAALQASGRLPESTSSIVRRWTRGLLTVLVILLGVAVAGYEIRSIWTTLSAMLAMIAIGFVAVWSLLSNVSCTILILIWRPFNVGEVVELQPDGISGQVIDINFMYTLLKAEGGARIAVPNSFFLQKCIRRKVTSRAPVRTLAEQLEAEEPAR